MDKVKKVLDYVSAEVKSVSPLEDKTCAICLNEMTDNKSNLRKMLNCPHIFHSYCLQTWIRTEI